MAEMTTDEIRRRIGLGYSYTEIADDLGCSPQKVTSILQPQTQDNTILTPRELQVINLVAEGLSTHLISKRINISRHTVKFHVNNCFDKLDAKNRLHAVIEAVRRGYIDLPRKAA